MARELATIQRIEEVQPIKGADFIEKVRVKGWWVVTRKGDFKVGNLCVYHEIDSLLPSSNPAYYFFARGLKEKVMHIDGEEYKGYRLKTVKLRGQISQGLALPIEILENWSVFGIGMDVSEVLGIVKYEPPIPADLSGTVKGVFPHYIPKTDEERVQNLSELIARDQGKSFYVTEKLDGASATYFTFDGEFRVCSRNWELDFVGLSERNTFKKIADRENLRERIPEGYAVQGEIIGEGIQGNPLKLTGQDFFIYNVYDIANSRYLNFEEFNRFCNTFNLKTVPIIMVDMELHFDVPKLLEMADGISALSQNPREGIVFRPMVGTTQRYSFKAISNEYLLNHE